MLVKMLETRSPAFYPLVSPSDAIEALDYAAYYRVESWDGYLVELAKSIGNSVVYTLDEELGRVEGVIVVNPFPKGLTRQYHEFLGRLLGKRRR